MKKTLLTICALLFCQLVLAQTKGYKEIKIGTTLPELSKNDNYEILVSPNKLEYYFKGKPSTICNLPIKYIRAATSPEEAIKVVGVLTEGISFDNFDGFLYNFTTIIDCIIETVGKPISIKMENPGGKKYVMWDFKSDNTYLILSVKDVGTFETNFKRNYEFLWSENTQIKMW